jgi:hypothetical protein
MTAGDKAAGVLGDNGYVKNPSAFSLESVSTTPGGKMKVGNQTLNGKYMYTVDAEGKLTLGTRGGQSRMPHPTLVGGVDPKVQSAGIIEFRGGKIYSVDNASGHFKPGTDSMGAIKSHLDRIDGKSFHSDFAYRDFNGNKINCH